jgi:hypothetical protein
LVLVCHVCNITFISQGQRYTQNSTILIFNYNTCALFY